MKSSIIHKSILKTLPLIPEIEEWHSRFKERYPLMPSWKEALNNIHLGNDNNIWTSSNYGIFSFNPLNKSIKSYLVADGLQDFEFNSNSNYQSQDGELMFIGIRGLNYFYPKDIVPKSSPPQVVIQNAVVGDESVNLNTDRIVIPWYDNKVVFDFAALSYRNPSKNQYSYNLDGYDSDWVYSSDNRRFATYTNLPAGDYTFKVKGSSNDGIWNKEGALRLGHLWEYKDDKAFIACQKLFKEAEAEFKKRTGITWKLFSNRGVVLYETVY